MDRNTPAMFISYFLMTLCIIYIIIAIFEKTTIRYKNKHNNFQKLEPFIILGEDLRGYEIRKDQNKYWIFTDGSGEPAVVDVTYKPGF